MYWIVVRHAVSGITKGGHPKTGAPSISTNQSSPILRPMDVPQRMHRGKRITQGGSSGNGSRHQALQGREILLVVKVGVVLFRFENARQPGKARIIHDVTEGLQSDLAFANVMMAILE